MSVFERALALIVVAGLLAAGGSPAARAEEPGLASETSRDPLTRMATLEERIGDLTAELEREDAQRSRLRVELDGLGTRKQAVKHRMIGRVHALYRLRRAGFLPLGGGVNELLTHVSRVERFERVVAGDVRALRQLRARGDAIRTEQGRLEGSVASLRDDLRALEVEREGLSEQILAGRFFREGFGVFEDGRQLSTTSPSSFGMGAGAVGPGLGDPGATEGMALPVRTLRGVEDRSYEGGPALALRAGPGAPVRAVAPGRVGYVGRYADLGRIVIVDHGADLYAIYGGLASSDVRVSEQVAQGGRLGQLDGEGVLFVQLRRGTRALNPRVLLGL